MKDSIIAKFNQHPVLREELLMTGGAYLVEHTRNDKYWGDGGDGGTHEKGRNRLGALLMEVREEIRKSMEVKGGAGAAAEK